MKEAKAFLFDLNGAMIDDMEYHLNVWYDVIVNELGANLSLEEVKLHMYGKNHELLIRIFGENRFTAEEVDRILLNKERQYQQLYRSHRDLLPGLFSFLDQAYDDKIKMAIGSAAISYNIDLVLDNF